ncbi:uracil-DNA glycosylase family protein [Microbacterium sp. CFBP9034]|uniref:uracil-DNA glycosylase family protein n=1 Tax=Microbacterium sp. CFBP9034 TaxID=3096540 RepID=UPI003133A413
MSFGELPESWRTALGARSFGDAQVDLLYDGLDRVLSPPPQGGVSSFAAPDRGLVFRALHLTSPDEVRVVILGQDPYPQAHPDPNPPRRGVADGLAFSSAGLWPQPSLAPLLWNLRRSGLQTVAPCGADLEMWARRGVLLLNASLVYADVPIDLSLQNSLREFSRAVLAHCAALAARPAFLVLGGVAWKVAKPVLGTLPPEQVVRTRHPSRPPWPGPHDPAEPFVAVNTFLGARQMDWSVS